MIKLYKLKFKILCKVIEFELNAIVRHKQVAEKLSAKIVTLECEPIFKKMEERKNYL